MEVAIARNRNKNQGDHITISYLVEEGLIDEILGPWSTQNWKNYRSSIWPDL